MLGINVIRRGYISRRPKSIANDKMIFAKSEYFAKLMPGSTCENIGPILLKQLSVAVIFASKSSGSNPGNLIEMRRSVAIKNLFMA